MKLIDYWLPCKSQYPTFSESELQDQKRHGHFALGVVSDAFSFYFNITQQIICIDQLDELPRIILEIFMKESEYLEEVDQLFWNEELRELKESLKTKFSKPELQREWIKSQIEKSDFLDYVTKIFSDFSDIDSYQPKFSTNEEFKSFFKVLVRIYPLIERRIFVTHINAPTPFYLTTRQNHVFCLWYILWLYEIRKELSKNCRIIEKRNLKTTGPETINSLPIPIEIRGIPTWHIQTFFYHKSKHDDTKDKKSYLGIAGPYIEANDETGQLAEIFNRFTKNEHCLSISPQKVERLPSKEIFNNSLKQRVHHTQSENKRRIRKLSAAWYVLSIINMRDSLSEYCRFGADDLNKLAINICWIARFSNYPTLKDTIINNDNFFFKKAQTNNAQEFQGNFNINNKIHLCYERTLNDEYATIKKENIPINEINLNNSVESQWVLSLREMENRILFRRQNLYRNVTEQMSHVLNYFAGINYFQDLSPSSKTIHIEVKRACNIICSLLCQATGASSSQLFIINYGNTNNLLETVGLFAREPGWIIPAAITEHINQYKHKTNNDNKPTSFVLRALNGKNEFIPKFNVENADLTPEYAPYKPKSGIAVPLIIHGRILGVLQVKGDQTYQFSERWMSIFIQTARLLAPFLFQLRLTNTFSQIQQFLAREIDFSTRDKNTLNPLAEKLSDIMLIDNIYIILRNSELFDHYALKGHNYNTDFYESIESENNAVVIFSGKESDKENIFANFEGIIQGDNSVLIKNTNRFDYLHCKYKKDIDKLRIKLYPNFRETHPSVEIIEYKKSLPLIIQKAFDKKPIFPNGDANEIIVFPIVSPPESSIKPELQNNTYYDDTIDERLDKCKRL